MLSGYFENCYGIKRLTLTNVNFSRCNKAIIYAPNGVMKTSFAKVFEDISKGIETKDRIFSDCPTSYAVTHYTSRYVYPPTNGEEIQQSDNIYVINSFADKFEFTKETVHTLLADEGTRNEYNALMAQFGTIISEIEARLRELTGLTKPQIKGKLISDLQLAPTADWPDIIDAVYNIENQELTFLDDIRYSELFNDKAMAVYTNPDFRRYITEYIDSLEELLRTSSLLNEKFTERSAEELSKSLSNNNLFEANHKIVLNNGIQVNNLDEWKRLVQTQLDALYQTPALARTFEKLKKLFSKNADAGKVRDIIIAHREIIPFLRDIPSLKKQTWFNCYSRLDRPLEEYYTSVAAFKERIRSLYEQASGQSERWEAVIKEFNRRFRVPFKVKITNKSNFILKDEAPNIEFEYYRGSGEERETAELKTDDLKNCLSMGERRALYLLYILFDLERIRKQAREGAGQYLILTDDISDSFDYKNKYAIIEYLNDLANTTGVDLLILTHNFDFFRTVKLRLNVSRPNCYIAQRNDEGEISLSEFRYQRDFFKNVIISAIRSGIIDTNGKKKCLIASIPFYRNLSEYGDNEEAYLKLTCFLHLKTTPLCTERVQISDLWSIIKPNLNNQAFISGDGLFMDVLYALADDVLGDDDEISLENKLVLSIASRLKIEQFMKTKIVSHLGVCADSAGTQTREWYNLAKPFLTPDEIETIEEVNLVTPENIHLNAFMYEPLIDVSIWNLKTLYQRAKQL